MDTKHTPARARWSSAVPLGDCSSATCAIGWQVDIYERSPHALDSRGGGIVLQPEVIEVFRRLGIDAGEVELGVASRYRTVLEPDGTVRSRRFAPQMRTSWSLIYSRLRAAFGEAGYQQGRTLVGIEQDAEAGTVAARFADGSVETGDLLIGADGGNSTVRQQIWPEARPSYAGYGRRGLVPGPACRSRHARCWPAISASPTTGARTSSVIWCRASTTTRARPPLLQLGLVPRRGRTHARCRDDRPQWQGARLLGAGGPARRALARPSPAGCRGPAARALPRDRRGDGAAVRAGHPGLASEHMVSGRIAIWATPARSRVRIRRPARPRRRPMRWRWRMRCNLRRPKSPRRWRAGSRPGRVWEGLAAPGYRDRQPAVVPRGRHGRCCLSAGAGAGRLDRRAPLREQPRARRAAYSAA